MNGSRIGKIALALWGVTVVATGLYVIRGGNVAQQTNGTRQAILLSQSDREMVLSEMRTMLASTQQIVDGLAHEDMAQVANAAKAAGMGSAIDLDPNFLSKLPLEFKTLGFGMHSDMDAISKAANSGASSKDISSMLSATLSKCVGCHSAWELKIKP